MRLRLRLRLRYLCILLSLLIALQLFAEEGLKLNEIQIIGSHNSYKKEIDPFLLKFLKWVNKNVGAGLDYSHPSLDQQLDLGLRSLELDVYYDPDGGRYSSPWGSQLGPFSTKYDEGEVMGEPGFKVLHAQDVDFRSHCLLLRQCLEQIKIWSVSNQNHLPLIVTVNPKDTEIKQPGFEPPIKFSSQAWKDLDKEIRLILSDSLITPDDVRGSFVHLKQAVISGWPSLSEVRGKILFVLDASKSHTDGYIRDYPKLRNRVMFVDVHEDSDLASFRVVNDPIKNLDYIKDLVSQGFIVRTRADADTKEARSGDYQRLKAAIESGAQIISTDYYLQDPRYSTTYTVSLPGEIYYRCNPVLSIIKDNVNCQLIE